MLSVDRRLQSVLNRIKKRSQHSRQIYLKAMERAEKSDRQGNTLACSNLAHSLAGLEDEQKCQFHLDQSPTRVAIISSYNDLLSAHQPFFRFPMLIKKSLAKDGVIGQFAAGVPAMCDGITQGRPGMELSLFSRDTIAMSTAIALSHEIFAGVIALGCCDKIVPGLLMGLLSFGYLPAIFLPAGPMSSGLAHQQKQKLREQFAQGLISRAELLEAEKQCYHGPGTCTFYGTANTNQLLMEFMGLHLPASTFIQAGAEIRDDLTEYGARLLGRYARDRNSDRALYRIVTEESMVNAIVALMASGGSTNHTLHLPAIARCAGIQLDWTDFDEISRMTPQLLRIYPSGSADVNQFQEAGGTAFLMQQLLELGLLFEDVMTIWGKGLRAYTKVPRLEAGQLYWQSGRQSSGDESVLRPASRPFVADGGLRVLAGPLLGKAIVKVSAIQADKRCIRAPALIFHDATEVELAFKNGELNRDSVIVLPYQGPKAKGMPELHKVSSLLGIIQDRGFKIALLTDGRLSGASAKVLAAIHVSPEAAAAGGIARIRNGDIITIDAESGQMHVELDHEEWMSRKKTKEETRHDSGCGRDWFYWMRQSISQAAEGASVHLPPELWIDRGMEERND